MNLCKSLLLVAAGLCGLDVAICAQTAEPPPLSLAVTINDAADATLYRGWPLIFQLNAALMDEVDAAVTLDSATAVVSVQSSAGTTVTWPFRSVAGFGPPLQIGNDSSGARLVWLLSATQTTALAPGEYFLTVSWAGRRSSITRVIVADAPAVLAPVDEVRLARLEARVALLAGKSEDALAVLKRALAWYPESSDLLMLLATVYEARGELAPAYKVVEQVLDLQARLNPKATHPPRALLRMQGRLFDAMLAASRAAPRPSPAATATAVTAVPASVEPSPASTPPSPTAAPAVSPVTAPNSTDSKISTAPIKPDGVIVSVEQLDEAKISAASDAQWAAGAVSRTQYSSPNYSATRATGAPDVPIVGDSPAAWCPASQSGGSDWLEVSFVKPVNATEVRVRQSNCPGAIVKIEAFESDGTSHLWWEGVDSFKPSAVREIVWFAVRVPKTSYLVAKVKITLDLAAVPGWKQIDAVQLVGVAP